MHKKTGLFLFVLSVLPFLLGTLYFQYVRSVGGQSTTNYGELISPMKEVTDLPTKGLWTFVVIAKKCHQLCRDRLLAAETTRVLTNEHAKRVRTVFISTYPLNKADRPTNLKDKIILPYQPALTKAKWQQLISSFALSDEALLSNILLVDPQGHFMMRYPPDKQDPKFMLKDIKRLLKYSRIG